MQQSSEGIEPANPNLPPGSAKKFRLGRVGWLVLGSSLLLFICSSVRHALFQSGAFDLGIFDQAVYLISRGQAPISSFLDFHILGDHAAWILYLLAIPYWVYPDVHWLLAIQALAMSLGAIPVWHLARQAGVNESRAIAIVIAYLLYPLVFNVNLFDFHPDVLALPALLTAIWAARQQKLGWFVGSIAVVLGCKAVLSLTVLALGLWLLLVEKRRGCGAIAIVAGLAWFLIATQVVIPTFGGTAATLDRHAARYGLLGSSFAEIARNAILRPDLVLSKLVSLGTLEYLALLLLPLAWGLSYRHLLPLIGALPALLLNILSEFPAQRNLIFQYSLPVLPFLFVVLVDSAAHQRGWLRNQRAIVLWSLVAFLALAKYGYFGSTYLEAIDTRQATQTAVAEIQTGGAVLTTHNIAPHVSQRSQVEFTNATTPNTPLARFNYVLLNLRHPGWQATPELINGLMQQLSQNSAFQLYYRQDQIVLFVNKVSRASSPVPSPPPHPFS